MRDYIIEATEAGYRVFIVTGQERYPLDDRLYNSLVQARDRIPRRYQSKARLVHRTAYTEMINSPAGPSPAMDIPLGSED